jgi:hypothetical protein
MVTQDWGAGSRPNASGIGQGTHGTQEEIIIPWCRIAVIIPRQTSDFGSYHIIMIGFLTFMSYSSYHTTTERFRGWEGDLHAYLCVV